MKPDNDNRLTQEQVMGKMFDHIFKAFGHEITTDINRVTEHLERRIEERKGEA